MKNQPIKVVYRTEARNERKADVNGLHVDIFPVMVLLPPRTGCGMSPGVVIGYYKWTVGSADYKTTLGQGTADDIKTCKVRVLEFLTEEAAHA